MRDDLHRSLPLSDPWRDVVRRVARDEPRKNVADAMVRAVNRQVDAMPNSRWHVEFETTLLQGATDLFGSETTAARLVELERRARTPTERQMCETAQGLLASGGTAELAARTVNAIRLQLLEAGIEHAAAKIAAERGHVHGMSLLRDLSGRISECDFNSRPSKAESKKVRAAKLLDMPLDIVLE